MRSIQRHVIGPEAVSDGVAWEEEQVQYMGPGGVLTTVQQRNARRCSCGGLLEYGASPAGVCAVCGRTVCSREGCSAGHCERCGALVCRRHAVTLNGHVFCSRHRGVMYWRAFWGVLQ